MLRSLRGALGGWSVRGLLSQALVLVLYARLSKICLQMERLTVRFAAGQLWRVAVCARLGGGSAGGRVGVSRNWPGLYGWLVRLAGHEAAGFGSQLQGILQTPEMMALLEASPQARRVLRPICRMLAIETSWSRVCAPKIAASDGSARSRVQTVVEPERIPLPRGVVAVARRQGFGRRAATKG